MNQLLIKDKLESVNNKSGLKILQVCKKFPYPLKDGESIAVKHLSKAMYELGCDITLLAMNTSKHYIDLEQYQHEVTHYKSIYAVDINNHLNPIDAVLNLFSKESYHISRYFSKEFEEKLIALLDDNHYDIIQLETLYLTPYIPVIRAHSDAKIVMRSHNVEFEIWERITNNSKHLIKKTYLNYLTKKLKRFELSQLNQWDYCLGITKRDLDHYISYGMKCPAMVCPIGLDISDYMANSDCYKKPLAISFIGSLDWMPNLEALSWFLDEIWTGISNQITDLKFHIAGRNTPLKIKRLQNERIIVHGEVNSSIDFINSYPIMVVPILSGGGMRAKILEGMALGKVIITTSIGLEGIEAKDMDEVLIANTPQEFIDKILWANNNFNELLPIGQRAQVFVAKYFDNYQIANQVINQYNNLTKKKFFSLEPTFS